VAVEGLEAAAASGNGAAQQPSRTLGVSALEVAVLDRTRQRRTFRRITGNALRELLPAENRSVDAPATADAVGGDDTRAGGGDENDGPQSS
jgi:proteasome alpha subunit